MKKILLLTYMLLLQPFANGETTWNDCDDSDLFSTLVGRLSFQISPNVSGECMILVGDGESYPEYRRFMFNTAGDLIVFNSFAEGGSSASTGASSFILFPIVGKLLYKLESGGVRIQTPSGVEFWFSALTGTLEETLGVDFSLDPVISAFNDGGLELFPVNEYQLILREGWRQGELPRGRASNTSEFLIGQMATCEASNQDIFDYIRDENGVVDAIKFKYRTLDALEEYLGMHCRQI